MGEEIYQEILCVVNGKMIKLEDLGYNEFFIYKIVLMF